MINPDNEIYLRRMGNSPWGVFGSLRIGEWSCKTLERPWEGNQRNISCIPSGSYYLESRPSPLISRLTKEQYQEAWEVMHVPGRTHILFHPGNWIEHSEGCILVGAEYMVVNSKPGIVSSRKTFDELMAVLSQYDKWRLNVFWPTFQWP
jgi:hypothetical protein